MTNGSESKLLLAHFTTWTIKLKYQHISKFFWKPLLFVFHATLIIMSRKYFFGFWSLHLPFSIRFWTKEFPFVMRSDDLGRQASLSQYELVSGSSAFEVCIKNDSDRKIFKDFLKSTLVHVSCYPDHYQPKILFQFLKLAFGIIRRKSFLHPWLQCRMQMCSVDFSIKVTNAKHI